MSGLGVLATFANLAANQGLPQNSQFTAVRRGQYVSHALALEANARLGAVYRAQQQNLALTKFTAEEVLQTRQDVWEVGHRLQAGMAAGFDHLDRRMGSLETGLRSVDRRVAQTGEAVMAVGQGLATTREEMHEGFHEVAQGLDAVQAQVVHSALATAMTMREGFGQVATEISDMSAEVTSLLAQQHADVIRAHQEHARALADIGEMLNTPSATQAREASRRAREFFEKARATDDPDARDLLNGKAREQLDKVMEAGHANAVDYANLAWLQHRVFAESAAARENYIMARVEAEQTGDERMALYLCECLVEIERERGGLRRAAEALDRAIKIAPERDDLALMRVDILIEAGRNEEAAELLEDLLKARPQILPAALMIEQIVASSAVVGRIEGLLAEWEGLRHRLVERLGEIRDGASLDELKRVRDALANDLGSVTPAFAAPVSPQAAPRGATPDTQIDPDPTRVLLDVTSDVGVRIGKPGVCDPGRDIPAPHGAKVLAGDVIAVVGWNGVQRIVEAPVSGFLNRGWRAAQGNADERDAGRRWEVSETVRLMFEPLGDGDRFDDLSPKHLGEKAQAPVVSASELAGQTYALGVIQSSPWLATLGPSDLTGLYTGDMPDVSDNALAAAEAIVWRKLPDTAEMSVAKVRQELGFMPTVDGLSPPAEDALCAFVGERVYHAPQHGLVFSRALWSSNGYAPQRDAHEELASMRRWMIGPAAQELLWYLDGCMAREESRAAMAEARERARGAHTDRLEGYRRRLAEGREAHLLPGWRGVVERALDAMAGLSPDDLVGMRRVRRAVSGEISEIASRFAEPLLGYNGFPFGDTRPIDDDDLGYHSVVLDPAAPAGEPLGHMTCRRFLVQPGTHVHAGDVVAVVETDGVQRVLEAPATGFVLLDPDMVSDDESSPVEDAAEDEEFAEFGGWEEGESEKPADPDADLVVADEIPLVVNAADRMRLRIVTLGHVHLSPWFAEPGAVSISGSGGEELDTGAASQFHGWKFVSMDEKEANRIFVLFADPLYPRRKRGAPAIIGRRFSDKPVHDVELSRSLWSSKGFAGVGRLQRVLPDVPDAGLPSLAQELLYFLDGCIARAESLSEQKQARESVAAAHAAYVTRRDELVARNEAERARREAEREQARERKREQGRALARKMKAKRAHEAARDKFVGRFPPGLRWFARWLWWRLKE